MTRRYLSFTFDDGLIAGTRKAVCLLRDFQFNATFYVVTGWVRPRQVRRIRDPWNSGRDHGSWADWQNVSRLGHDVGSHTVTHMNARGRIARWFPQRWRWELQHSHAELQRQLGRAPTSISMPWNTPTDGLEGDVRRIYSACRLGAAELRSNDLNRLNWHRLSSWAPNSDTLAEEIIARAAAIPDGYWLILQFHSFDGEGYMPLRSANFRSILSGVRATPNLEVRSVDEMIRKFRTNRPRSEREISRSKRRICLITSEALSTNPRLVKEADALSSAGYNVRVVSCQWTDRMRTEDAKLIASRSWSSQIINFSRRLCPELFWLSRLRQHAARGLCRLGSWNPLLHRAIGRVVPEMIRAAISEPADLFIGHNIAALPAAVLAARRQGALAGFDAEDMHSSMWLKKISDTIDDRIAWQLERNYLSECAYITAAAPLIAGAYARGHPIGRPEIILNVFPTDSRPKTFRPNVNGAPLTLYWFSQTIGARRGLEDVIYALSLIGNANAQFHLRGEWQQDYRKRLDILARDRGLRPGQIIWHESAPPDDLIRLAAQYDVGLALEEPVSENRDICLTNKIFTYLLAGNAVIATDTRGQTDLMQRVPGAGCVYAAGDVNQLAKIIKHWLVDRAALETARRRAWAFGDTEFNWDLEQKRFVTLIDRVLERGASRP